MSVSRREALLAGAGLSVTALAWKTATAQVPGTAQPGTQPAVGAVKVPTGRDALIGTCLLVGGRRQIEACKWAIEKLQNEDCKAFAKAEIEEHETIKTKLEAFGLMYPNIPQEFQQAVPVRGTDAADNRQPAGGVQVQQGGVVRPVPAIAVGRVVFPPPASDFVLIDHQLSEQCIATYKERMGKKQGVKLDKAFVSDQLHTHVGLLDKVLVFKQHSSAEMMLALNEGQRIIEQHIATCEQLMNKLDGARDGERPREGNIDRDKDK